MIRFPTVFRRLCCRFADSFQNISIIINTMLAHNYLNGADKNQLVSGSNYAYSTTNNRLLTGFLFRQIFLVVLFTSKDFSATVSMVREKSKSYQIHSQTIEIKKVIQIILTFSLHSVVTGSCCGSGHQTSHTPNDILANLRCI